MQSSVDPGLPHWLRLLYSEYVDMLFVENPQHAKEVIKNINYVLGPSSREILFYLREDADGMSAVDFVEEEGYLFAIPLKIF
jgi:hypothetical protein